MGVKFIVGVKYLVTLFVYHIPVILVVVPIVVLLVLATLGGSHIFEVMSNAAILVMVFLLVLPYSLFIALLTPIVSVLFAQDERIGEGLQIGKVLKLFKRQWQDSVMIVVISFAIGIAAVFGILLFLVGILLTSFYVSLVRFHLYGQMARAMQDELVM